MSHLSTLISAELPPETTAVQQKTYVTFTCIAPGRRWSADPDIEPTVTLLERRHLISGSLTTGFRTWEAALHLGSYLLTTEGADLIRDKSVLELGAGTGFLPILCAKHLEATPGESFPQRTGSGGASRDEYLTVGQRTDRNLG